MKVCKFLVFVVSSIVLTACGGNSNLAESHLKLLSQGKTGDAQSQYCSLEDNLRLVTVNSYEMQSESSIEGGTEYVYAVDSPEVDGELIVQVIDSDIFFDFAMTSNAELNEALESSSKLLGIEPELSPVPKREEYSQNESCVFLPFEQFKDE